MAQSQRGTVLRQPVPNSAILHLGRQISNLKAAAAEVVSFSDPSQKQWMERAFWQALLGAACRNRHSGLYVYSLYVYASDG